MLHVTRIARGLAVIGATAVLLSCTEPGSDRHDAEASGQIPVTTASAEARSAFREGQVLADGLRITDARPHFERAVAADPELAWGHLMLATTAPTAPDFWASLEQAQTVATTASDGERLLIEAFAAGVNAEPDRQLQLLEELVAAYPESPRAHLALATYHFGRQEWDAAIAGYRKVSSLAPDFPPPYNQLGYALRFTGDFDAAEAAFRTYVELLPDQPNPYDSLAELLWKRGRFAEAIDAYEQALEQNPQFVASYVGIGNNQLLMGDPEAARETWRHFEEEIARTPGERRQACTWAAMSYLHQGDHERALAEVDRRAAIAEASGDRNALAADDILRGNILLDAGRLDEALEHYSQSLGHTDASDATPAAKQAARRTMRFNTGRVALARGDLERAEAIAAEYLELTAASGVPFEIWQAHELAGAVALARGDAAVALDHLAKANQQDPRVMLLTARAHRMAGDDAQAREWAERAAHFNGLSVTWPFVRDDALAMLET